MRNPLLIAILVCIYSINTEAQELISYELLENVTKEEISAEFGLAAQTDLEHYKMQYTTKDLNGVLDTASGLVSIPVSRDFEFPLLLNLHGTVDGPADVPSNLAGGFEIAEIISSYQFIGLSPDYLGLGSSRGLHPYVHADSEASATLDMMYAFEKMREELDVHQNEQIFITGYSQGGHAAMAIHRELETNHADEFTVTAASHMSGPYSISRRMVDATLGDSEYFFVAYLASVALTMLNAYPELLVGFEITDIFKPEYIPEIMRYANGEIGLFELNSQLTLLLGNNVGAITPKDMLFPDVLDGIKNDPSYPLSMALADNDVYDWTPNAPTRLLYCTADEQVSFENALLAEEVMKANGASEVIAVNQGEDLNHGGCVNPAVETTLLFFLFKRQVSIFTSTTETATSLGIRFGQNNEQIIVYSEKNLQEDYIILDALGNKVQEGSLHGSKNIIEKSMTVPGIYILKLKDSKLSYKLVHSGSL